MWKWIIIWNCQIDLASNSRQSESRLVMFTLCGPMACQAPLSMEILQARILSGLPCPPLEDLPNPGIEPRSPALQADSLSSESPGKPKNTGVGSLSLLQGIWVTQESNWGLLHCRCFLNLLSNMTVCSLWNLLKHHSLLSLTKAVAHCYLMSWLS